MEKVFFDAGHIFAHYLEASIPREEWERMTAEQALTVAKDVGAILEGSLSPAEFGKKYRLPRKK